MKKVAPVRERGLKCSPTIEKLWPYGRSRKGAWIEMIIYHMNKLETEGRSRKGAWIEILSMLL